MVSDESTRKLVDGDWILVRRRKYKISLCNGKLWTTNCFREPVPLWPVVYDYACWGAAPCGWCERTMPKHQLAACCRMTKAEVEVECIAQQLICEGLVDADH